MLLRCWMEFLREILIVWRITDSTVFLIPLCRGEWIKRVSNLFSDFCHGRPMVGKKKTDLARWALSRTPALAISIGVTVAHLRLFNPRNLETGTLKLCGCAEKVPVTSCPFYGVYKFSLRVLGLSSLWHPYVTRWSIESGGPLASNPILFFYWCMRTLQTLGLHYEGLLVFTLFLTSKRK